MKLFTTLTCAVALTVAFAASRASADFALNINGTALVQNTVGRVEATNNTSATTKTASFNNKQIYLIISNAVANVSDWAGADITPANLPANGYIAYDPGATDAGDIQGVFYVTNKTGFYYPLSGSDQNGGYYSWIELDTQNSYFAFQNIPLALGWVNYYVSAGPFNGAAAYNINSKGSGTETETSTALLYIHDDPYCYDDADHPNIFFNNYLSQGDDDNGYNGSAVEMRGVLTATLSVTQTNSVTTITPKSFSLTGTGNMIFQWDPYIVVKSGTAKFAK